MSDPPRLRMALHRPSRRRRALPPGGRQRKPPQRPNKTSSNLSATGLWLKLLTFPHVPDAQAHRDNDPDSVPCPLNGHVLSHRHTQTNDFEPLLAAEVDACAFILRPLGPKAASTSIRVQWRRCKFRLSSSQPLSSFCVGDAPVFALAPTRQADRVYSWKPMGPLARGVQLRPVARTSLSGCLQ